MRKAKRKTVRRTTYSKKNSSTNTIIMVSLGAIAITSIIIAMKKNKELKQLKAIAKLPVLPPPSTVNVYPQEQNYLPIPLNYIQQ